MRKKDQSIHSRALSDGEGSIDGIEFMEESYTVYDSPDYSSEEKSSPSKTRQLHAKKSLIHNELEKSRRAQLKACLDRLRKVVPIGQKGHRNTTLSLLTKSKHYIRNLEEKEKKHLALKEDLVKEQRNLKKRLEQLQNSVKDGAIGHGKKVASPTKSTHVANTAETTLPAQEKEPLPTPTCSNNESNCTNNFPHILKRKGYEIGPDSIVTEINVEDADGYCLLLDDIDMLQELEYRSCGINGEKYSKSIDRRSLEDKIRTITTDCEDEPYIELCEVII